MRIRRYDEQSFQEVVDGILEKRGSEPVYTVLKIRQTEGRTPKESPVEFLCSKHNITFEKRMDSFMYRCPYCPECYNEERRRRDYTRWTMDKFLKALEENGLSDYRVVEEIHVKAGRRSHVEFKLICPVCNSTFINTPANILYRNRRCPECGNRSRTKKLRETALKKTSMEEFEAVLKEEHPDYTFDRNSYEGCGPGKTVTLVHKCGYSFQYRPETVLRKMVGRIICPACMRTRPFGEPGFHNGYMSVGELVVDKTIQDLFYEREKPVCINGRNLRFDFYFELGGRRFAVEFDGNQHFNPAFTDSHGTTFEKRRELDLLKNEYCEKNGISLLRINESQRSSIQEMIGDLIRNPDKYLVQHNTYLSNEEYYSYTPGYPADAAPGFDRTG